MGAKQNSRPLQQQLICIRSGWAFWDKTNAKKAHPSNIQRRAHRFVRPGVIEVNNGRINYSGGGASRKLQTRAPDPSWSARHTGVTYCSQHGSSRPADGRQSMMDLLNRPCRRRRRDHLSIDSRWACPASFHSEKRGPAFNNQLDRGIIYRPGKSVESQGPAA